MHLLHGKKCVLPKLCCQVCLSAGVARSHAYITHSFKHIGIRSLLSQENVSPWCKNNQWPRTPVISLISLLFDFRNSLQVLFGKSPCTIFRGCIWKEIWCCLVWREFVKPKTDARLQLGEDVCLYLVLHLLMERRRASLFWKVKCVLLDGCPCQSNVREEFVAKYLLCWPSPTST
jgi:hypothetical protein